MIMKKFMTALVFLASTSFLTAQVVAGPNRPGNVPEGYVVTPFGYFHPSCVQSTVDGDTLLGNGQVQHKDGTVQGKGTCDYPRYAPDGTPKVEGAQRQLTPEVRGWVEEANIVAPANNSYSGLVSISIVPPQPKSRDGQTLFFFPGLEDINNPNTSILQPVLQWTAGQWSIVNWNCCLSGITTHGPSANVNPNDQIMGTVMEDCFQGTLSCAHWNVTSLDLTTGANSSLLVTPSQGQVFNWAFGAVMEPYYVVSCNDYPANLYEYNHVVIFDKFFNPVVDPVWTATASKTVTPQCGYGVSAKNYIVSLGYN
jgi:hypothetical protein